MENQSRDDRLEAVIADVAPRLRELIVNRFEKLRLVYKKQFSDLKLPYPDIALSPEILYSFEEKYAALVGKVIEKTNTLST